MKESYESHGKVRVHTHATFEDAQSSAYQESASTGGYTFPVTLAKQGNRLFLSGALPIVFVQNRLVSNSVLKGGGIQDTLKSINRPLERKHVNEIAKYIIDNTSSDYIIPSLTLNVQEAVNVHTVHGGGYFKAGYMVIPIGVNFSITDGQHRVHGLIEALRTLDKESPEKAEQLRNDSIAVMITCEHNMTKIHQDFADCSKTKSLPKSMLSVFDMRNPANRILSDIISQCPLFRGKIDTTSKTLSKVSSNLFLANQVRQVIKQLLMRGSPTDADFERRAKEQLEEKEHYDKYLAKYVQYVNQFTEAIPILKEIASIAPDSPKKSLIPKYRAEGWICLNGTGLNVLGALGHDLITYEVPDWLEVVNRLSEVSWSRDGELWQDNIVSAGRIMTQTGPTRRAVDKLEESIGLDFLVAMRKKVNKAVGETGVNNDGKSES